MSLDNRYAALSSTEEAPGAQSERRALAPREPACSDLRLLTSPGAIDRDIHPAEEPQFVQPETAALPAREVIVGAPKLEATSPEANASMLVDLVKHIDPSCMVPLQSNFTFTCPVKARSSTVACLPTADSGFSSASRVHNDQAEDVSQKIHEVPRNSQRPLLGISAGESRISAAQPGDHGRIPDVTFATKPFSVELSANHITLAVPPLTYHKRGWPSPTNSPPAPTTRDRKSRFFPTSFTLSPEIINSNPRAPHYSFPLLYQPPDPAPAPLCLPTLAPSSAIKPRTKKPPPPPITITYSPLHSPILIRRPLPHSSSDFNSIFQICPPGGVISSGSNKKQNGITAFQQPGTKTRPQVQNGGLRKISMAGYFHGPEQDLLTVEGGEGEGVEVGTEELRSWELEMQTKMEGWVGEERGFWG